MRMEEDLRTKCSEPRPLSLRLIFEEAEKLMNPKATKEGGKQAIMQVPGELFQMIWHSWSQCLVLSRERGGEKKDSEKKRENNQKSKFIHIHFSVPKLFPVYFLRFLAPCSRVVVSKQLLFSVKDEIVNILGFASHIHSLMHIHLFLYSL